MPSSTRQLAAIMFTDIVGYTTLMGKDSNKAMEILEISKSIQQPLVKKHNGKWLKEMGDGVLASFGSALDAVNCAVEIQKGARAELDAKLRIGIHLGDVTIEQNDVHGDGVNVASRLESVCEPGGIYISDSIAKAIRGQTDIKTVDLGELELKNVNYGVRTFSVQGVGLPVPGKISAKDIANSKTGSNRQRAVGIVALGVLLVAAFYFFTADDSVTSTKGSKTPKEKSLAVLPFADMSPDRDQEWFSDGLTEELLNSLAKIPELRLISRTSSFAFKGKNLPVNKIADSLGVSYILEGSVRKAQDQLRITAQLIDAGDDAHLWSENYNYAMDSVFVVQEDIAENIARVLNVMLDEQALKSMLSYGTRNVAAYEAHLKGLALYNEAHVSAEFELLTEANVQFEKAIELDPQFADAYADHQDLYAHMLLHDIVVETEKKLSKEEMYAIVMQDHDMAIKYASNEEDRFVYQYDKIFLSDDWTQLRSMTETLKQRGFRPPGWGRSILVYTEPEYTLLHDVKLLRNDPLDEFTRIWAAISLVNLNLFDSARNLINQRVHQSAGSIISLSITESRQGNFENAIEILTKAGFDQNSRIMLYQLLSGTYKGDIDDVYSHIQTWKIGQRQTPWDPGPLELFHALGEFDKADSVAAIMDADFLGPCKLLDMFLLDGLPFHLSATPNLSARLREMGVDPEQFEKKYYRTLSSLTNIL